MARCAAAPGVAAAAARLPAAAGLAALHCGYAAAEAGLQTVCSSLLECSSLHQLCLNTLALISTVYLAALAIS